MNTSKDRQMQSNWLEGIDNPIRIGNTIPVRYFYSDKKTQKSVCQIECNLCLKRLNKIVV